MTQRCNNPRNASYGLYGAAGVRVCPEWRDSFARFLDDMGERPIGCTLDRIDGRLGYSKSNCRWATAKAQANNRKNNRAMTAHGKTMHLTQWAEALGISKQLIRRRIALGWEMDDVMSSTVQRKAA